MHPARRLWRVLEPIHAVTYFAPESRAAAKEAGLRGFWMGYFGFRAAPLGPVGPEVVGASFFNFAPSRVAGAIPDAWSYATPEALLVARARSSAGVLAATGEIEASLAPAIDELWTFAAEADHGGRPLSAANSTVARPDDLGEALWQGCTTLREHRGDGHVAALVAEGLSGLDAHVLLAATDDVPVEVLTDSRGWSIDDWDGALDVLVSRGLFDDERRITDAGRSLRTHVELRTDQASWYSIERTIPDPEGLARRLEPLADAVAGSGIIPFPNPMGLPAGRPSELSPEF